MSEQNGTEPHGWLNAEKRKTRVGEFAFRYGQPAGEIGA